MTPASSFFQHGYADGYAHGRIHGLIEGRAAGKEKGFELWEEVGYYSGFALLQQAAHGDKLPPYVFPASMCGSVLIRIELLRRASHHISSLLSAIDKFPLINPKPVSTPESDSSQDELDVSKLLSQIRSRYRALCSVLGVPPQLRAISTGDEPLGDPEAWSKSSTSNSVWSLDNVPPKPQPLEL